MCNIECPYKNKCTSHPHNCGTCNRNTGKRDYYKPRRWYRDWYTPHYPSYPQWRYTPYWTTTGNNHTGTGWTN